MTKVGYYCWAGPGTVRMLKLKYFNPKIDITSLMSSYNKDNLKTAKENFGITDIFATYSWGFSTKTEQPDYQFFDHSLTTFNNLKLKTHAYIQGPALVHKEHSTDWWAKDHKGRLIPYHRGRKVVCLNQSSFIDYQVNKISSLKDKPITGIYIDNVLMGQLPLPIYDHSLPIIFAGCNCRTCQKLFREDTGEILPSDLQKDQELTKLYLNWRATKTTTFVKTLSNHAHSLGFTFGINNYDPSLNPLFLYGQDYQALTPYLDYFFFETLSFPKNTTTSNSFAQTTMVTHRKPTFVESYKQGIGLDSVYTQDDFNLLYTESHMRGFNLAIKGSEYLTDGVWHNLAPYNYAKLKKVPHTLHDHIPKQLHLPSSLFPLLKSLYNPLTALTFENSHFRLLQDYLLRQIFS